MWKIDGSNNITMTKGDTPSFKIELSTVNETGEVVPYEVKEDDYIVFAVRENASETVLIELIVPNDTLILTIPEAQTKGLALGKYIYEISLNNDADAYHDTFVANKTLELTMEVY